MLFFVSVGMLFDPTSLFDNTWPILATLFIIVIGKSVAAFLIVIAFRYPVATALMISASLAQIGEFSFILAELGVGLGLLPEQGRDLILAGAILSIVLNPLIFAGVERLKPWLESAHRQRPTTAPAAATGPAQADSLARPAEATQSAAATSLSGHTHPGRLWPRRQPGRQIAARKRACRSWSSRTPTRPLAKLQAEGDRDRRRQRRQRRGLRRGQCRSRASG